MTNPAEAWTEDEKQAAEGLKIITISLPFAAESDLEELGKLLMRLGKVMSDGTDAEQMSIVPKVGSVLGLASGTAADSDHELGIMPFVVMTAAFEGPMGDMLYKLMEQAEQKFESLGPREKGTTNG